MPLPKMNPAPRAPEESMAVAIADVIRRGHSPKGIALLLSFDPQGRALLDNMKTLADPAELIEPFKADPKCWKHLAVFQEATLLSFARGLIEAAKAQG